MSNILYFYSSITKNQLIKNGFTIFSSGNGEDAIIVRKEMGEKIQLIANFDIDNKRSPIYYISAPTTDEELALIKKLYDCFPYLKLISDTLPYKQLIELLNECEKYLNDRKEYNTYRGYFIDQFANYTKKQIYGINDNMTPFFETEEFKRKVEYVHSKRSVLSKIKYWFQKLKK